MLPSEKIAEWIGHPVDVTRAIPLPSVANRSGVTVIYPASDRLTQLFGALGTVVNATSIEEVNAYSAAGSLMATYFGCLETAAQWMVDHGAEYERARTYLSEVFFGLAQTAIKSPRPSRLLSAPIRFRRGSMSRPIASLPEAVARMP